MVSITKPKVIHLSSGVTTKLTKNKNGVVTVTIINKKIWL